MFKLDLSEIKTESKKSPHQKDILKNITTLFSFTRKIIVFFRDFFFSLSEAKYKAKYGEGLKMLTSKQMRERLPIALARVKAGNN